MVDMSEQKWTQQEQRNMLLYEATSWCRLNLQALQSHAMPLFILQHRCEYIGGLLKLADKKCAEYCVKAANSPTYEEFKAWCDESVKFWNSDAERVRREHDKRLGIA